MSVSSVFVCSELLKAIDLNSSRTFCEYKWQPLSIFSPLTPVVVVVYLFTNCILFLIFQFAIPSPYAEIVEQYL